MRVAWMVALSVWVVPVAAGAEAGADAGTAKKPAATAAKAASASKAGAPASGVTPVKTATTKPAATPKKAAKTKAATPAKKTTKPATAAASPPSAAAEPAPPPPAANVQPVQVAEVQAKVAVPSTQHLRVEVPSGLQHWLDEDDRMRPWLDKAIGATDSCYAELRAKDPQTSGVVEFAVTMHKDARPTATVTSMPAPLKSLVLCATTRLWSIKMPLFTGNEGARYSVKAHFEP